MFPARTLGQDRADSAAYIGIPDGNVPSGQTVLASKYTGPSAGSYDWESGPCS